ncbi:thioesterase II family protein (plasmid) [Streptomyces sp. HUAS TT3]|uniref:thioesterase II family protein n=1 Tax=Streptomyces sp. HUAS TT3 TaxID=3447510 RepID=UPI003F65AA55
MTRVAVSPGLWTRQYHARPEAPARVFCFPHAGGSASSFHPMSASLAAAQLDVVCLQYPGRQDRLGEPCVDDLHELADRVVAEIEPWLDRPVLLFGHSMGATVAFEVALRMEHDLGIVPRAAFFSGRRAPSVRREGALVDLESDEALLREIRSLGGTDARFLDDEGVREMILPAIRGDFRAVQGYRPSGRSVLSCPVRVLTGDGDPKTTVAEAEAWSGHTTGPCEVRVFRGDHFFLADHLPEITRLVAEAAALG